MSDDVPQVPRLGVGGAKQSVAIAKSSADWLDYKNCKTANHRVVMFRKVGGTTITLL